MSRMPGLDDKKRRSKLSQKQNYWSHYSSTFCDEEKFWCKHKIHINDKNLYNDELMFLSEKKIEIDYKPKFVCSYE